MINLDKYDEKTASELCLEVAAREKKQRKARKMSRKELSARSGVTVSSLRRFEETGEISFHSLVLLLKTFENTQALDALFSRPYFQNIQEVIDAKNY